MKTVLDTYAWIEYFRGTGEGEKVRETLENSGKPLTPSVVIAELKDKYVRTGKLKEWKSRRHFIRMKTSLLNLDYETATRAGELKWELREEHDDVGLADSIILAHAEIEDAKLLTGDKHLTHREETVDLKS